MASSVSLNNYGNMVIAPNYKSLSFDGSTSYLQTTTTALTGAWTIEFWAYHTSFGGSQGQGYVFNGTTSSNANRIQLGSQATTGQPYIHIESTGATQQDIISSTIL
jgi:hypothetical protein